MKITYVIFSQDYKLASHVYVASVDFMVISFTLGAFARNLLRESHRKSIFVFLSLNSCHNLLDCGGLGTLLIL